LVLVLVGKGRGIEGELREWFRGAGRVVVVGVGNPIRMDDFVGVAIVRGLRGKVDENRVMLIEAETIPEDHMQEIIDYKPTHVLLIDAAVLGLKAGEAKLIKPEQLTAFPAFSTHMLPLRLFCEYLSKSSNAAIALLLVEPERTEFGEGLSSAVLRSEQEIAKLLRKMLA
jgi:hydrogenase 3 maturation protease